MKDYRQQIDNEYKDKIKKLCNGLPDVVKRFDRSMQLSTEVKTRFAYISDIKIFMEYLADVLNVSIKDITVEQLENCSKDLFEDYFDYLMKYEKNGQVYTNGKKTLKRKLSSLKRFYSYLLKSDLISVCNIEKIDVPKIERKELVYMDSDEVNTFLDKVETGVVTGSLMEEKYHDILGFRNYVIMVLLLTTGIRVSECVGLDVDDIDFKNSCIKVIRKGNKEDSVFFPDSVGELLDDYLDYRYTLSPMDKDNKALFLSTRNTRLGVRSVEMLVKKYAKASVPLKNIHCHSTRSSFAMEFLKNSNGDIEGLQSALGHNNIATTQFYARSTQDMKKSKKEMVTFDNSKKGSE